MILTVFAYFLQLLQNFDCLCMILTVFARFWPSMQDFDCLCTILTIFARSFSVFARWWPLYIILALFANFLLFHARIFDNLGSFCLFLLNFACFTNNCKYFNVVPFFFHPIYGIYTCMYPCFFCIIEEIDICGKYEKTLKDAKLVEKGMRV